MLALTLSLLAACISSPLSPEEGQASENQPVSLQVAPANVWLSVGGSQQVVAWVTDPEGGSQDIEYTWTSSDPDVVEIGDDGMLHARGSGEAKISVTADKPGRRVGQRQDAVTVTVTDSDQETTIGRILGVPELGDRWSTLPFTQAYDAIFDQWGETHWDRSGAQWEYTYYDRALVWYAAWWRTGDAKYLERGHADALAYREDYVLANNGQVPPRWMFVEGLAVHYILTGDQSSADAVAMMAKHLSDAGWIDNMLTTQYQDGRIQGRAVFAQLIAGEIGAPRLKDWDAELGRGIENLLEWYQASGGDGSWDMSSYCGGQASFQVSHAVLEVLIRYHDLVTPDTRIPDVVKNSLDHMWQFWDSSADAFPYNTVECDVGNSDPAPDLNLLIVWPFGWYYQVSGNSVYRDRGDAVFQGGLDNTYWNGHKQFNQSFMRSWRYPHVSN